MCLQRLGKIISLTPSHNFVVKTEETPKIGLSVIDQDLSVVGRVFDIIGPVSAPYAVIKPNVKEPEKLVNQQLYLLLSKKKRSKTE
ncbi:MAG TPA: Gar1/Naf1 family protein [Candidatus Bathyarchaeia archaeon]